VCPIVRGVAQVLVVEDDPTIRSALVRGLTERGHAVASAPTGLAGLEHAVGHRPDVVVLDLGLPDVDGAAVLRMLRGVSRVPVVVATARDDEAEIVAVLDAGADDYVVKPFKPQELIARVRARLRRGDEPEPERLTIGDLAIDVAGHSVTRDGSAVSLTPLEFDLLVALARKPWQVFTREVLLEQVWGYRHAGDTRLVNVHVQRLRSKIEHDPEHPEIVVTVRGVGYKAGQA